MERREMFNIDVKLTKDDESEVLRYLQHNGKEIDKNLHSQVLECMEKINAVAIYMYQYFFLRRIKIGTVCPHDKNNQRTNSRNNQSHGDNIKKLQQQRHCRAIRPRIHVLAQEKQK